MDHERSSQEGTWLGSYTFCSDACRNAVYRQVFMGVGSLAGEEVHFEDKTNERVDYAYTVMMK